MAARRKKKREPASFKEMTGIDFEKLWKDPKYVALHEHKDKVGHAWNMADAYKNTKAGDPEKAERLKEAYDRALRAIYAYEEEHGKG